MALKPNEISELARSLSARYASLLEEVREQLAHGENQQYVELLGRTPGDAGDVAVADALADLNVGLVDRHIHELRDIEAARVRIREGSFGRCIACGGEIRVERLRVYPTAKRCVTCQGQRERTYASPGTPSL